MIEIHNLTKSYGDRKAISKLNFKVNKGEIVGFLGPNGAGKTTTMKIITGFMAPTSGSVKVCGYDVFENPIEVKKRIGYLPETPPVYGEMLVREYLEYVAHLKGVTKAQLKTQVEYALEKTFLKDVQKRVIQNLSKGFRQRVGLAQALVSDPEVLILDEPTVGLDPKQVAEIRNLIQDLKGKHTVILSTHILPEVQASCERIIIINKGHIVAEDTLKGLERRMSGGRRVMLKVKRPAQGLMTSLRSVSGVATVNMSGNEFYVDIDDRDETVEAIAGQAVSAGVGLLELKSQDMNLEDIFIKLTSDENTQGARI